MSLNYKPCVKCLKFKLIKMSDILNHIYTTKLTYATIDFDYFLKTKPK